MPHEVITLQLGGFANYVGAHFWNLQDELLGLQEQAEGRSPAVQIDSGMLFRAGETPSGQPTYTPRLVLCDLSGALGGASAGGALYRDRLQPGGGGGGAAAVVSTWHGGKEVHRAAPISRSRFAEELENEAEGAEEEDFEERGEGGAAGSGGGALAAAAAQLDGGGGGGSGGASPAGVRYWTDFLKAHLHPRSVHQLAGAWHGLTPFSGWGDGEQWRSQEQREEAAERIRFFAEECDHLQGFQCLVDDLSGFGQLATHMLQEIRDEYGGGLPVMLYALRPGAAAAAAACGSSTVPAADDPAEQRRRRLNEGLSLAQLAPLSTTFVPVAPPAPAPGTLRLLRWQPDSAYHVSALCAAAVDTATLPYRLAAGGTGPAGPIGRTAMSDLCQLLTARHGTSLAALSLSMPCPPLPVDTEWQAQQADARQHHARQGSSSAEQGRSAAASGGTRGGGGGGGEGRSFTTQWLASLTPGIAAVGDVGRYAESIVLRGPRAAGAAMALGAAAEALDTSLAAEGLRCVRRCTLVGQPLLVPLPFPHVFARGLSSVGDLPAGGAGALPAAGSQDLASCAVLTRLGGTTAFGPAVASARRQFAAAAGSGQGQAALESWGLGREEVGGMQERLTELAHAYDAAD